MNHVNKINKINDLEYHENAATKMTPTTSTNQHPLKRKRKTLRPPASLGVLEFSSALNGDDPLSIFHKLLHFVKLVRHERRVALSDPRLNDISDDDDDDDDHDHDDYFDDNDDDDDIILLDETVTGDDGGDGDPSKRQKRDDSLPSSTKQKSKTPSWKLDTNNYQVPFVGTSIARGPTGTLIHNVWPTGFLEAYRKSSPYGVELLNNEYISALPSKGAGVHARLYKSFITDGGDSGKDKKKKGSTNNNSTSRHADHHPPTRGQILSMAIQCSYWNALSEWILGFVPIQLLKNELHWMSDDRVVLSLQSDIAQSTSEKKCTVPPTVMTILMKLRLPEWVDAVNTYSNQLQKYNQQRQREKQQPKQDQQKQKMMMMKQQEKHQQHQPTVEENTQAKQNDSQHESNEKRLLQADEVLQRETKLFLSSLNNLIALCHLSNGTAREVLRRLMLKTTSATGETTRKKNIDKTKGKPSYGGGYKPISGEGDASVPWMVQVFRKQHCSSSTSCRPQLECLRLVCTLLETKDNIIISRLIAPSLQGKQGGGGGGSGRSKVSAGGGDTNGSVAHIALRYGMQKMIDLVNNDAIDRGSIMMYARFISRLLRNVREIILLHSAQDWSLFANEGGDGSGITKIADMLAGDVLTNLTKLSALAPPYDADAKSIRDIIDAMDSHDEVSPIKLAGIDARRILFLLLADPNRSPFLHCIHQSLSKGYVKNNSDYLPQLSRALHEMISNQGHDQSIKILLDVCLRNTPELVPHFFSGLHLSDTKPAYRSLAILTFIEGVVRDAPLPLIASRSLPMKQLLAALLPSCITKLLLGKIIQSPSSLMVSSGLKLLITILRRGIEFTSALDAPTDTIIDGASGDKLKRSISQAIIGHFPDVTLLLSIPNRFDPFQNDPASNESSYVVLLFCEALRCYSFLDSTLIKNVKFDWTKLVPNEGDDKKIHGRMFSNAEPLLQQRLMSCLLLLSRGSQIDHSFKMLPGVISVLVSTQIPEVYTNARHLALVLMERYLFTPFNGSDSTIEGRECMKYETSLWIDGISDDIIQELVRKIEDSKHQHIQQKILVAQSWSKTFAGLGMPSLHVSSLLISSISKLVCDGDSSSSKKLSDLSLQVATRMLLFQADPRPLAAIIVFSTTARILGDKRVAGLYRCSKRILDHEMKANTRCESMSLDTFHPEKCGLVSTLALHNMSADSTTMRQYLSMMKYSQVRKEKLNIRIRRIFIGLLESGNNISGVITRLGELFNSNVCNTTDLESYMVLLLSSSLSKTFSFETEFSLNCVTLSKPSSIAMEVTSELMRCLVPTSRDVKFISDLISRCVYAFHLEDERTVDLKNFLITLLHTIYEKGQFMGFEPDAIFDLWLASASNLANALTVEFSIRLECILSALFSAEDGQGAWAVYQQVCSLSPTTFMELWLNIQLKKGTVNTEDGYSLLRSVVEYDCSQFSCLLNLYSSIGYDEKVTTLWDSGILDSVTAAFVTQSSTQRGAKAIIADASFIDVASTISRRFIALLNNKDQKSENQLTITEILATLELLCSNQHLIPEMHQCILSMFDDSKDLPVDSVGLMNLAICLGIQTEDGSPLLTKVFLRCCQLLPKHIKIMLKTKGKDAVCAVDSLVGILSTSMTKIESFDMNDISTTSHVIDNVIVACLKYGMMELHDATICSILGGCLKMIRILMETMHGPKTKCQTPRCLTPSQVHAMVISHSSFHQSLSQRKSVLNEGDGLVIIELSCCYGLSRQLELIRLLLCTVSLDSSNVKIDIDTWTVILSVYNASTDLTDAMLRRLMFLYERNGCYRDEIFLNNLRWGNLSSKMSNADVDEDREWFVDAIEFDRIRLTLTHFPVEDALVPVPFNEIEVLSSSDDIDDRYRDRGSLTWSGTCEDLRYSPGFILPLILASLDVQLPQETTDDGSANKISYRDEETVMENRAFAHACRKIADKGGIALAIASLSSRCPSIRRVAIAICGLFLKALQMEESHGIKSWRDRPQQEMIMSSLQRGLAVRRSMQIQKKDTQEGDEHLGVSATDINKNKVPMLPAVSAIFLAKALMVISKPEDDMYGQVNRYFLRLTDYHGAFQDFFGIPSFLSLYCSSSDDISRSRIERKWALNILKDGVVDEFCYRIISQHHVPELVMSSFDFMLDDPESKSELFLTLEVIEVFLRAGGKNASDHLIQRQGILSWLHGILSWRQISHVLPDVPLKCKCLELITTAVGSFRCYGLGKDDENRVNSLSFYEKIPLANIAIRICLDGDDQAENEDGMLQESKNTLLESTCNALWAIYLADKQSNGLVVFQGVTSISEQCSLLKKCVRLGILFEKVLAPLCALPLISDENDVSSAYIFCGLALSFLLEMKMQLSSDTILLCMKRVHELMKLNPRLQTDVKLMALIVNFRHLAVLAGGLDVWNLFLPYVTKN